MFDAKPVFKRLECRCSAVSRRTQLGVIFCHEHPRSDSKVRFAHKLQRHAFKSAL